MSETCCNAPNGVWLHPMVIEIPVYPLKKPRKKPKKKPQPWLSMNDRSHWSRRQKLTEWYREKAAAAAEAAGSPAYDRLHVTALISFGDNRKRDAHNYMPTFKACVDGLVDAGVVVDDNDKHVTGPDPRRAEVGFPCIRLVLQHCECDPDGMP